MDIIEEAVRQRSLVCHTQGMALERQEQRPDARIFSFESPKYNPGCRKFIAAELGKFWAWYGETRVPRHFYEIIQEERPCRPYFDLEYAKDLNPELDPSQALRDFLGLCREMFAELLNVVLTDRHFLLLESSSDKKFSVHVVVHLPGKRLLPDNVAMKPFVDRMRERMTKTGRGVVKATKGEGFICDHTVYTKNRNFRLYLSSKCGKDATLRLSRSCRFYGDERPTKTAIFFDSLVVPKEWDSGEYEMLDLSTLQQEPIRAASRMLSVQRETRRTAGTISLRCNEKVEELAKYIRQSPFRVLDAFLLGFLRQFTPDVGSIRLCTLCVYRPANSRCIQYELSHCRYCLNIGRQHKRQNVLWKVDLDRFVFFQMCFDVADCPGFVSEEFDLPLSVQGELRPLIDPLFAKFPRRTTPTHPAPSSTPDAAPSNDLPGDVQSQPARDDREEQSDSDVEVLDVNTGPSRRDVSEPVQVKRPRRTPMTNPLSSPPAVISLDDPFRDLQICPETPDVLWIRPDARLKGHGDKT